jgi:hypothetical protein
MKRANLGCSTEACGYLPGCGKLACTDVRYRAADRERYHRSGLEAEDEMPLQPRPLYWLSPRLGMKHRSPAR